MINLVPMNEEQYKRFFEETVKEYAEENVKAGRWTTSESIKQATKETNKLLPKGIQSKGHFLCSLHHDVEGVIGTFWYEVKENMGDKSAFIYSFQLNEEFQGKGYGKQSLIAFETDLVSINVSSIRLHVFGHNKRAHQLYTKMGYIPTSIKMEKHLRSK